MAVSKLGQLEEVRLRDVWSNEAQDFTPWLAEHLDLLGNAIGLELERVDTEVQVGGFSLDILAEAEGIGPVAIENQLGPSDHTHLGQLATYAAGVDAKAAVWVASAFRPEHLAAVEWLNRFADEAAGVFAVEVRALKIGDSLPAAEFRAISLPQAWAQRNRSTDERSGMTSEERDRRVEFFERLLTGAKERNLRTSAFTWSVAQSKSFPCEVGEQGLSYWVSLRSRQRVSVQLDIRTATLERNAAIISALERDIVEIFEGELGFRPELLSPDPGGRHGRLKGSVLMLGQAPIDGTAEEVQQTLTWCLDKLEAFQKRLEPKLIKIVAELNAEQADGVADKSSVDHLN